MHMSLNVYAYMTGDMYAYVTHIRIYTYVLYTRIYIRIETYRKANVSL